MSLSVKQLNGDTSFFLTFSPPSAQDQPNESWPGSFTILIDPWLFGPSKIWTSWFSITHHTVPSCVTSLADLPVPDLVLVSQDKSDHCHKESLLQLPEDSDTIFLGTRAAAKKMKSWKYFDPSNIYSLPPYDPKNEDSIFRIAIPAFSEKGTDGEVTISLIAPRKFDITGLHNAFGITYRPPSSMLSATTDSYKSLPSLPPTMNVATSQGLRPSTPTPHSRTSYNSPFGSFKEKAISVLYTPHGIDYPLIEDYASSHLLNESALPLTMLMHSFNRSTNPWWLGGNVCAGSPSGMTIARNLYARTWLSAHDEEKIVKGVSVLQLKVENHPVEEIKRQMKTSDNDSGIDMVERACSTELVVLDAGQVFVVPAK